MLLGVTWQFHILLLRGILWVSLCSNVTRLAELVVLSIVVQAVAARLLVVECGILRSSRNVVAVHGLLAHLVEVVSENGVVESLMLYLNLTDRQLNVIEVILSWLRLSGVT